MEVAAKKPEDLNLLLVPIPRKNNMGTKLRIIRAIKNISIEGASSTIGVDEKTWRRWESGEHRPIGSLLDRIKEKFPEIKFDVPKTFIQEYQKINP